MPFKKGKSGNPNGRKAGTPNRVTHDLRERVQQLLEEQFEQVLCDLGQLEPRERLQAWTRLLEYAIPKLQRTEGTTAITASPEVKQWIIEVPVYGLSDNSTPEPGKGEG